MNSIQSMLARCPRNYPLHWQAWCYNSKYFQPLAQRKKHCSEVYQSVQQRILPCLTQSPQNVVALYKNKSTKSATAVPSPFFPHQHNMTPEVHGSSIGKLQTLNLRWTHLVFFCGEPTTLNKNLWPVGSQKYVHDCRGTLIPLCSKIELNWGNTTLTWYTSMLRTILNTPRKINLFRGDPIWRKVTAQLARSVGNYFL